MLEFVQYNSQELIGYEDDGEGNLTCIIAVEVLYDDASTDNLFMVGEDHTLVASHDTLAESRSEEF
jgi:hypothetical protein